MKRIITISGILIGVYFTNCDLIKDLTEFTGLKWKYTTNGYVRSSPAIGSDGTIYVGSWDGNLYALYGSETLASTPWPMFHHDLKHTGRENQGHGGTR